MSDTTESLRRKIAGAGDLRTVIRTMKAMAQRASKNHSTWRLIKPLLNDKTGGSK
jgi:hypothetical protein